MRPRPQGPDYVFRLGLLATCLRHRASTTFSIEVFNEAVEAARKGIKLSQRGSEDYLYTMDQLAKLYKTKYDNLEDLHDLDAAIEYTQDCIDCGAVQGLERIIYLTNLSALKKDRLEALRLEDDARSAVQRAFEAEKLANGMGPEYEASAAAARRSALLALCLAGKQLDRVDQLNIAIEKMDSAIKLSPEDPDVIQFERTGDIQVLERAIEFAQLAVKSTAPNDRKKLSRLNALGNLLERKFVCTGEHGRIQDLHDAVESSRNACKGGKNGPDHAMYLNTLSTNPLLLYEETQESDSLEEALQKAIELLEKTNESRSRDDPERANSLLNLGNLYYLESHHGDRDTALQYYVQAYKLQQGQIRVRLRAAQLAMGILKNRNEWDRAREIGCGALELLPDLCDRSLTLSDQQHAMAQTAGLAADVCSLYLQKNCVNEALQKLEFGHGLMLRYMIDRQSDVSSLERDCPDLALEYRKLQFQAAQAVDASAKPSLREHLVRMRIGAGEKLKDILHQIRQRKGYESFLLEPTLNELTCCAADGVIVVVNVTSIRADAIIVSSNEIRSIELPDLKIKAISYSKTLSLSRRPSTIAKKSLLIVAMPTTPGQEGLSGVSKECLTHPTAKDVCERLPNSNITHFACHGSSNKTDPSQSCLLLQKDGTVDKLTVSQISSTTSNKLAWIAYLSACSTAQVRSRNLADEKLHIASAFQVAGFLHVIGSLWQTKDRVCVKVAEYFYKSLIESYDTAATDLLQVRSEIMLEGLDEDPMAWAGYIHLGA
ncbi:CHAT domain-containing protein [Aspergillus granulosus]|uniref:CHAT domain-containing protein n=1 Tax=Aspergillus granulosus TaxID=176169 RepID=A0ABR4HM33_9EURO